MANKTFGNKAKGAVKSFLEQTASMFNPEPKGTPSGDVDIAKMIEKTLAASIGAVMFGKKSGVEDYNALKGQLSKKSFIEQINDGMKGITSGMQGIRDVTKNISNMLSDLSGPIRSIDLLMNETITEHTETLDLLKQISDTAYGKLDLILSRFDNLETYAEFSIEGINGQITELRNISGDISTLFDAVLESGKSESVGGENILNFVLSTDGSTSMEELSNALVSINDVDSEKIGSLVEKLAELNQIKLDNIPNITEGLTSFNESFSAISQSIGSIANDGSLMENLQSATEKFSAIKNFFDNDIAQAAASVAGGQDKVKQITDGIQKTSEDMDNASSSIDSNSQVNIQASFEGLGKTILLAGATMLLGGWILSKNPQLIVESLKFGAVLTVFITMTMAPMLMLKVFNKDAQDVGPILDAFGNFIIKATFVMLLGGLIFMIGGGKIIKNAMKFGVEFAKFILLCSLAMIPMKALQGVDVNSVATFVVKATLIMMLGALFVMLGGGKIMKNALQFGILLGLFIFIVLLPFRLLGGLFGSALKAADEVARLIVTTTIIMMLGALFLMLGGGKIATMALAYGIVLGLFIFLVMLPFKLLFGRGSFKLALDIKLFQNFLITTTILLMVGALFMTLKGGEYAINAIKFGGLLMLFTIGILLPFIILKQPLKQAWSTIIAITALILVEAVVLMLGVQLVEQGLVWEAIGFTVLFAAFLIGTIAPFVLLQSTITEVWPSVLAFAALVAVTGLTITLLTATIQEYGFGAVLGAAVTLVTTVAILTACFIVLGAILGEMTMGIATAGAMSIIIGTIALSLVLLMVAQQKGNMLVAAIILVGVMGLLVVMFTLLSIISPYISIGLGVSLGIAAVLLAISGSFLILAIATKLSNPLVNFLLLIGVLYVAVAAFTLLGLLIVPLALGSVAAMLMSAALMTLSAAFLVLHVCVAGKVPPTEDLNSLMSALVIAGVVFSFLGVLIVPIVLGSVSAVAMSVAFTTLSIAFLMLRLAIGDGTVFEDLKALNKALVIAGLVFTLLGVLSIPIVLGSAAAVAMSVAFTTLSIAFLALRIAIGDGTILQDMKTLNKVLVIAGLVFSLLGVLLIPITLALVSTTMMTTSLIMLSTALRIVGKLNADYKDLPKTLEKVFTGSNASIPQLKKMFTSLANPFLLLGVIAARKTIRNMSYAIVDIAYAYGQMGKAQKLIKEGFGDDSSKIFQKITDILKAMPAAFMALKDDKNFKDLDKDILWDIDYKNMYMSRVVSRTANVLGHMAHYTVLEMTEDGKFKTVVVKPEDMVNAALAINAILTTLTRAVVTSADLLKGIDFDDIEDFLDLTDEMGDMVASFAEGIKDYAEMMIPVYRGGKVVKKRPMNENDFTNAAIGIEKVITHVVSAVGNLVGKGVIINGKREDWEDVEDDLSVVIDASCHVGDIIKNIAEGIKNYADLKIPTGFDDEGKATGYRRIKDKDFQKAGENTSTIMTTMINALSDTYYRNKSMFEDAEEGFLFFKKKKENSSPIAKIIGIAVQISELIGNTAEGVAKMAALQIATDWDKNGKPIKFYTLQPSDFKKSGEAVNDIMSSMLRSLSNSYYSNIGLYNNNDAVNNVIKMAKSIGGIIAGIADGVQKMAAGKIAVEWNKEGKPIKFRSLTPTDVYLAGIYTDYILTSTANTIGKVYFRDWNPKTHTGKDPNPLFNGDDEDAPIMVAVKGVQKFGTIIANVAQGVQAIANLKVPIKWNKEGKPIAFEPLKIEEICGTSDNPKSGKLYKVLDPVLSATANAIGAVYYKDWDGKTGTEVNDLFKTPRGGFLSSGDAPIVAAVESLSEIFDLVGNVIEVVQNVANLRMPVGPYDKDGKPKKYETMSVTDITSKLEPNVRTILEALPRAISNAYVYGKKYNWWGEGAIDTWESMASSLNGMAGIISSASKILVNYGNMKAPVLDKKGNVKSYMDISKIMQNIDKITVDISLLLTLLPLAFQIAIDNGALATLKAINKNEDVFETGYDSIAGIVASIGQTVNEVARVSEIFKGKDVAKEIGKVEKASVSFMNIAGAIVNSNMLKPGMAERFENGVDKFIDLTDDVARVSMVVCVVVAKMQKFQNAAGLSLSPRSVKFTFNTYTTMFSQIDRFVNFLNGDISSTKKRGIFAELLGKKESAHTWRGLDNIKVKFDVKRFKSEVLTNVYQLAKSLVEFSIKFNAINYPALILTYFTFQSRQKYILGLVAKLAVFTRELNYRMSTVSSVNFKYIARMNNINTLFTSIGKTFNTINKISGKLEEYDFKQDIWEEKIQEIKKLQEAIYSAFTLTDGRSMFARIAALSVMEEEAKFFERKANLLLNTTIDLHNLSYYAATTNAEGITNITNGLDQLDESLSAIEWETISKFEVENDNLKEYVKTINKVDVSKVNTMANLFDRLESFMYSVGDLPKFTEALADKLSTGLTGVAAETRIAAKVIKDAERIQKARQENIKKAVKDVETLMGKTLQIEVSRSDDGNSLSGNYTGDAPASTSESSVKSNDGSGRTKQRT